MKKFFYFIVPIIIPIVFSIVWDIFRLNHTELTVEECKNVQIDSLYDKNFTIYYMDSIEIDNRYSVIEYRITNTGNKTIFGYGEWSDILAESNKLPIIDSRKSDLRFIKLIKNDIAILDQDGRLIFKQWKPKEYIDIICISRSDNVININDRDIKDVRVVYKNINNKTTRFEQLSMSTKWFQVVCYCIGISPFIVYIVIDIKQIIDEKTNKGLLIYLIICLICILYTFSLPLRWLLPC